MSGLVKKKTFFIGFVGLFRIFFLDYFVIVIFKSLFYQLKQEFKIRSISYKCHYDDIRKIQENVFLKSKTPTKKNKKI